MTLEDIERAKEVAKRNLSKYQTAFIVAPPEDIRDMKDDKLREDILGKTETQKKTAILFEEKTDVKKHTQGKGDKVQRYSPDGKQLLQTYESYIAALRDPKIDSPSRSQMKMAAEGNFIYKGFRWGFVRLETAKRDCSRTGGNRNRMLNLDQTEIVKVFANQKEAAKDRHFSGGAAISNAKEDRMV